MGPRGPTWGDVQPYESTWGMCRDLVRSSSRTRTGDEDGGRGNGDVDGVTPACLGGGGTRGWSDVATGRATAGVSCSTKAGAATHHTTGPQAKAMAVGTMRAKMGGRGRHRCVQLAPPVLAGGWHAALVVLGGRGGGGGAGRHPCHTSPTDVLTAPRGCCTLAPPRVTACADAATACAPAPAAWGSRSARPSACAWRWVGGAGGACAREVLGGGGREGEGEGPMLFDGAMGCGAGPAR